MPETTNREVEPFRVTEDRPDELRLRRAGKVLSEFGTLWRNPVVPDRLREEALREIFGRLDVDGPKIVAVHPQPNENAWLLGLVAAREQRLPTQRVMGLVGARGLKTSISFSWGGAQSEGSAQPSAVA
jgi:hypothetical protein